MTGAKVIAIVGPTASGKSDLGVFLAKKFSAKGGPASGWNGAEIISADSRQIYKGLDVGSGKITPEEMKGVPHYMLDVADPARPEPFTLAEYLNLARQKIDDIQCRHKLPFIVGGTGLYITALLEGYSPPEVKPDTKLRAELEQKDLDHLQKIYQELDPEGFEKIDKENARRLIRAIEVVKNTGKPFFAQQEKQAVSFDSLVLGIDIPFDKLKEKIKKRVEARFPAMLQEVKNLNKGGVSWERLENFGLEYKWMARLARAQNIHETGTHEIHTKPEIKKVLNNLEKDIIAYARRQLTWWRKRDVVWISAPEKAEEKVHKFLNTPV